MKRSNAKPLLLDGLVWVEVHCGQASFVFVSFTIIFHSDDFD